MTLIPPPIFPQTPVVSGRILSRPQKWTQPAALWAVFLLLPAVRVCHARPSTGQGRLGVDEWK